MSDLEQRLRTVEDQLALIQLESLYARSFDEQDGDVWSALFTADGIYQSRPDGDTPPATFVQGTDALREFCTHAPFVGIHMMHLPQLTLDGDRAKARIHLEFHGSFANEPGSPRRKVVGFYDVAYSRLDGAWKIAHRVTTAYSREQDTVVGYLAPAL